MRKSFRFPREHGFWVMLSAVLASSLIRHAESGAAWLCAAALLTVTSVGGGLMRTHVRRAAPVQVSSAAVLGFIGVPVEVIAGRPPFSAVLTSLSWTATFVAGALTVRASFARARRDERAARQLELASVAMPAGAAALFAWHGNPKESAVATLGALTCSVLAYVRPSVKQMKPVGLALAALALLSALLLVL